MENDVVNSFLTDFDLVGDVESDEAFASISLNPAVSWARFILTDDIPNANKQRVPQEEFDNLIKTGIYMPIKMAEGKVSEGHAGAIPIGVISHLKKLKNQIHGLAALWNRERPEDVELIKNSENLQLSWEIMYKEASTSEDGVTDLMGTALRAVTLVGMPAYQGRTPILAVAEENITEEKRMELEERVKELETELAEAKSKLATLEESASVKDQELETLRTYKNEVEAQKAALARLEEIKTKFKEASITKDDEYFEKNKEMLLKLGEAELDFMLQELVAFSASVPERVEETPAESSVVIPNISGSKKTKPSPKEMGKLLREIKQ